MKLKDSCIRMEYEGRDDIEVKLIFVNGRELVNERVAFTVW